MTSGTLVIVAAHNEADRLAGTLSAVAEIFPGASIWVADDGSNDGTADIALASGAQVVRSERAIGKGGAVTLAARAALECCHAEHRSPVVLLCDGDLGESARELEGLVEIVAGGDTDLAVAVFARRVGGGVGLAVWFARWAIRRRCKLQCRAPISGQRAMRVEVLQAALPFAQGFGMEIGMTIDAVRAGYRVLELELDLSHRATGRTLGGFIHRGRQFRDFVRVYLARS